MNFLLELANEVLTGCAPEMQIVIVVTNRAVVVQNNYLD
jgi:hypothetical protein